MPKKKKEKKHPINPEEWQKKALELERQGFEITVIGRPGRLPDKARRHQSTKG